MGGASAPGDNVDEVKTQSAVGQAARSRPADLSRGTNQSGVRLYNERLVLSLIRRHGSMAKAEIARLTGLSAQTISVIMRQLEGDGLLLKEAPQRGKIGQPSVPFSLHPEGAFFLGLKIGRRSSDLVLVDFAGGVRGSLHRTYPYPEPAGIIGFVESGVAALADSLPRRSRERISGIGIAMPFELWNWEDQIGAPRAILDRWRAFDIRREIERIGVWPVYLCNDATAACGAELVFGNPRHHRDFLYVFIGWFIGGGVVLNGNLFPGRSGYAGALGPMPIPLASRDGRIVSRQLIESASTYVLERRIRAEGHDPSPIWESPDDWSAIEPLLDGWIEEVSSSIAFAIVSATSVIDFEAVIIDGAFPASVRRRIVSLVEEKVEKFDRQGLVPAPIAAGTIGSGARAIGGACLPLLANFTRDREVLFKESL